MKSRKISSLFLKLLLTAALSGSFTMIHAEAEKSSPHSIPTISQKPLIDGRLEDAVWSEACMLELRFEVDPGENITPPVQTVAYLGYFKNHLYIAFKAFDPNPGEIRARMTDRDNINGDDHVGIVLDTFNDSRLTYNFYCNPLGVQAEKTVNVSGSETAWDTIWKSAGSIINDGYVVEMEIPFSALRFQRKKGDQTWGIDLVRYYPRIAGHQIGLFPRDRNNNCYMCQSEKIAGFAHARPGKNLELTPTISAVLTQERKNFPDGGFAEKNSQIDPGLSARWRFTPNMTFSAAVNPDFSQVEADAAQLDINNQFVLIFPEKRPFFLEDANLFSSVFNVIFTRRVSDPDAGIKITGKQGADSIAFFSVYDNRTVLVFPWSQGSRSVALEMDNLSTAFRYRRDIGRSSSLGLTVTDREGDDYYNRLAGIDGRFQLTRKDLVVFQLLGSQTRYPDDVASQYNQSSERLQGNAMSLLYQHSTGNYGIRGSFQRISRDYRADLGSNSQVDFQYYKGYAFYAFRRNPGFWYTRLGFEASYEHETDTSGILNYDAFRFQASYEGPKQSVLKLLANLGRRAYKGAIFEENYLSFEGSLQLTGSLFAVVAGYWGDRIDYVNLRGGTRLRLMPGMEFKWGRHLNISVDHIFEDMRIAEGHLYSANLSNLRLVYQINRRTFLRAILQYADYRYESSRYSKQIDPEYCHLFSQFLFSYKLNPQTVLFLGYSDNYDGYIDIPLAQKNRTFFLKIGHALTF